ncbi:MAG: putative toxin-antitoxin system toxin component, PIN family [Chitinophagaceae bacterium]|nr:putative toxin-antitoxin system toxin component, PIN family [Anaerolineae bacterium]
MTRVVLDANTVISALFWNGVPLLAYEAAGTKRVMLITSEDLLTELETVLSRPKFKAVFTAIGSDVERVLAQHRAISEIVIPVEVPQDIVRDSKDRVVLACAVGGNVDYIVTGDKDLLILESYAGIKIINAARFLEWLNETKLQ